MENVVLVIHLILALCLIGIVLLQRSEGGGLGMGSGGGAVSSRAAATALGKLTWLFAAAFISTSVILTVIAAQNSSDSSVLDRLGIEAPATDNGTAAPSDGLGDLLPPTSSDSPLVPPRAE